MTVNEMIKALQEIANNGFGDVEVNTNEGDLIYLVEEQEGKVYIFKE